MLEKEEKEHKKFLISEKKNLKEKKDLKEEDQKEKK